MTGPVVSVSGNCVDNPLGADSNAGSHFEFTVGRVLRPVFVKAIGFGGVRRLLSLHRVGGAAEDGKPEDDR